MATEKKLNTRIINKHDDTSKWNSSSFVPKEGEIIIVDDDSKKIKIGDGKTAAKNLPFLDAVKADKATSIIDSNNKSEINIRYGGNGINSASWFPAWTSESGKNTLSPMSAERLRMSINAAEEGHTHDNRYYTESEINSKLAEKSNTNHTHTFNDLKRSSKENWSGSVSSVDRTLFNVNRACRTAFLPKEAIKIEISNNGGDSWEENTSNNKIGLFSMNRGFSLSLGSQKPVTTQNQTRITIEPLERYAYVDTFYCWFSTSGHTCVCDIERSTIGEKDKFSYIRQNVPVSGWSGPNEISFSGGTFGGGTTQYSNNYKYRFTFKVTKIHENYKNSLPSVTDLRLYGDSCWTASNNMMSNDNIFSWDNEQNVTFPKKITASYFKGDADSVGGYHIEYDNGYTSNNPTYICGFDTSKKKIKCASNGYIQGTLTVTGDIMTNGAKTIKEGDSRLTNPRPASDVYSWAKTSTKPTYSWNEIQSKPDVLDSTMTLILDGGTSTKNI